MAESDFFSDDDLDQIPDNTLRELEQHAITSTQKPQSARSALPQRHQRPRQAHNATSLNRGRSTNANIPWRPPQRLTEASNAQPAQESLSQQYAFDDESVVNLADDAPIPDWSQSQTLAQRPAIAPYRQKAPPDPETAAAFAAADVELQAQRTTSRRPEERDADIALRKRIAQLEAEAAKAQDAHAQMRKALEAKAGEITIVRANAEKERKDHDRKVQALQRDYAAEAAKHKLELEANRKEREKMQTDNRFLQHDLAQEADRAKRQTGALKTHPAGNVRITPKKPRRVGPGDGFEENEVRPYSPSRSKEKDATPKNGIKRKRSAHDSPVQALSFTELAPQLSQEESFGSPMLIPQDVQMSLPVTRQNSREQMRSIQRNESRDKPPSATQQDSFDKPFFLSQGENVEQRHSSGHGPTASRRDNQGQQVSESFPEDFTESSNDDRDDEDAPYFVQSLLNHHPRGYSAPVIEVMTSMYIPPDIDVSLSSVLLAALSSSTDETVQQRVVRAMAKLWTKCLKEQHFVQLELIVEILQYALAADLPSNYGCLAEQVVPLCLQTLELVTVPVVRTHMRALYATEDEPPINTGPPGIAPEQITAVLEELCQGCALSTEYISSFWHSMDFTSSLLLLHKALPLERAMSGLNILATSVLPTSFGAINKDPVEQEQQEKDTVLRLTFAFFEIPTVPEDEVPYEDIEILEFRLLVLEIMKKLCVTDHGSRLLATHHHFIGRLVKFVDDLVRKLYLLPPAGPSKEDPSGQVQEDVLDNDVIMIEPSATSQSEHLEGCAEHDAVVAAINLSVRILQSLMDQHKDLIDFGDKFAAVTGGYHSFLIGMTRLAFIEQPAIYEYGIEEDVIDTAHSILDTILTPEDGEAVAEALETPQGSRGPPLQKSQSRDPDYDAMDVDGPPEAPD